MKVEFKKDGWCADGLTHAYSCRFKPTPVFRQEEDHITNPESIENSDGYSYISLVTREKVTPGVKLTTTCSFEGAAAPLVVLAKDLYEDNGVLRYQDFQEVVLYANGLNIWDLWMGEDHTVKIRKMLGILEPVQENVRHTLTVEVTKDAFVITLDGHKVTWYNGNMYPSFHIGITGCEGVCRFYDLEIEQI